MHDLTGELIPLPQHIAELFLSAVPMLHVWGAIQTLRSQLEKAEKVTTELAQVSLTNIAQHVRTSARLFPPVLNYALWHSVLDGQGNVLVMLIKGGFTEVQLQTRIERLFYSITLCGTPAYILHEEKLLNVTRREIVMSTLPPQRISDVIPMTVSGLSTVRLTVKDFAYTVKAPDLLQANPQKLIHDFADHLNKEIVDGRTHDTEIISHKESPDA